MVQNWRNLVPEKLHLNRSSYALGLISKSEFLEHIFGAQYKVIEFLEKNQLTGNVIDNWTVWHAYPLAIYAKKKQICFIQWRSGKSW